jgi:hypothetical protein
LKKLTSGNSFSIENHPAEGQSNEFIHTEGKGIFTKAAILSKSKTQHFWDGNKGKRNRKTKENYISIMMAHENAQRHRQLSVTVV